MLSINFEGIATLDSLNSFREKLIHGISTKKAGSMSLGIEGANRNQVMSNRISFLKQLGLSGKVLTMGEQLHTANIHIVTKSDTGAGWNTEETLIPNTDALITNIPEVAIGIRTADCVAVFLYDPEHQAIGLAHAGWKGTTKCIAATTVQRMVETFNSNPSKIIVGLGPSIGPCCYEVRDDVVKEVSQAFPNYPELLIKRETSTYFNLWLANILQLQEQGIVLENIESVEYCTKHHKDEFFSFRDRMAGGEAGLFLSVMSLKQ